jgi:hypothetical protein
MWRETLVWQQSMRTLDTKDVRINVSYDSVFLKKAVPNKDDIPQVRIHRKNVHTPALVVPPRSD